MPSLEGMNQALANRGFLFLTIHLVVDLTACTSQQRIGHSPTVRSLPLDQIPQGILFIPIPHSLPAVLVGGMRRQPLLVVLWVPSQHITPAGLWRNLINEALPIPTKLIDTGGSVVEPTKLLGCSVI